MEMDFDLTKENIQPLPGGRNVQQLGIALQAQNSREVQNELMQQRQEFENAIESYQGEDPLENFYNYISWIEQSYPKNGHEGNLVPILEHCLSKFENDKRYTNDRRFCKLWIKYIDLQSNPLELYQMMRSKGLCVGCADLYRAWAYYHEAAGDFSNAHNVFELGKNALAQPYEELESAHKNLVIAAGQHTIFGPDESGLVEKRQALTSLHTYRPGRVGSTRIAASSTPGTMPVARASSSARSNAPIQVYEAKNSDFGQREAVPPTSIITAAKRQEVRKENTLKPGPWTTVPVKKRVLAPKTAVDFIVHEDSNDDGIRLPPNHPRETLEDYSKWRVSLTLSEPTDARMIPMYPKERVYVHPNCEYSIEELRSQRYIKKKPYIFNKESVETIYIDDDKIDEANCQPQTSFQSQKSIHAAVGGSSFMQLGTNNSQIVNLNPFQYNDPSIVNTPPQIQLPIWDTNSPSPMMDMKRVDKKPHFAIYEQSSIQEQPQLKGQAMKTPIKTLNTDDLVETGSRGGMDVAMAAQPEADSAKPMPTFSDDSSSSFEDIRNNVVGQQQQQQLFGACAPPTMDLNDSTSTQTFFFNMNKIYVSTPNNKVTLNNNATSEEEMLNTKKQLFPETDEDKVKLSTILEEETKYLGSSSSSGSSVGIKSAVKSTRNMETISEEHNSYLAQNLMANAALRSSLLGDLINTQTSPMPVAKRTIAQTSCTNNSSNDIVMQSVRPLLDVVPSDPFKSSLINDLLEMVHFPGRHTQGYVVCHIPRLVVRKEPFCLGNECYIVEKQLGKGTYGTVFKGYDATNNKSVALKYQKPINKWEYYICRELKLRLSDNPLRNRFMDVSVGYFGDQCSVLVSDYMPYGSLLDVANLMKQKAGRTMKESLCIYFCIEMLQIVHTMHAVQIIHADIKPDNFLAYLLPNNTIGLQLIDFGCSIDMSLFPQNTTFTRKVTTEDFICCEMRDGRPWSYHTDLFCVAATAHVLLYDKYIQLRKKDDLWSITNRLNRYWRIDMWNMFFSNLLNQQNGYADAKALQLLMEDTLKTMQSEFQAEMRFLFNMLKKR